MLDVSELMSTIDPNHVEPEANIIQRFRIDKSLDIPVQLTDVEVWANYTNDDLYEMDKKIREFLKAIRYSKEKKGGYKTTASFVFTWIFGRPAEPKDGPVFRMIHKLLEYYCTGYTGKTTFQGKKVSRVYKFSKYAGRGKRPYSLRLRLEEAGDNAAVWRGNPGAGKNKRIVSGRANSCDGSSKDE